MTVLLTIFTQLFPNFQKWLPLQLVGSGYYRAAGFKTYDRLELKKVVLYTSFIIKSRIKNVL